MEKKKSIKYIVIGLIAIVVFSFGVSYAYFVSRINQEGAGSNVGASTATKEDTVVTTNGSIGFEDTNIYPGHKNISKVVVTATGDTHVIYNLVWNGTNTLNTTINYSVYKTTTEKTPTITCTKKEEGTIRKELYEECEENLTGLGEVIKTGEIGSSETSTKVKLVRNEEIEATTTGAKVYYYIVLEYPNQEDIQNLDMNGEFTGNINIDLLEHKENASTDLIAKNEMVHETFTSDNGELIDTGYRYEGANPNNYVTFNNELWRIIGVFDVETASGRTEQLVKLIRKDIIGNIAWDTYGEYGLNDWTQSDIKTILNGQYYNGEDINYTYRNPSNSAISSNPTVSITGVSINDTSRSMIESVKWNIGGALNGKKTTSAYYIEERGSIGAGANPSAITWNGYIGLMYASDYGYAVDSVSCTRTTDLQDYNIASCKTNNWLFIETSTKTIVPSSSNNNGALGTAYGGYVASHNLYVPSGIRPSLYLKSNVSIIDNGNDGSLSKPYDLVLN